MQPPEESVATTKRIKLTELTPDNLNANKGSPRASGMLERSIQSYGAGRSVLVDKAGRIIAGNKTVEASNEVGIEDAIMVETDGRQLVVVKRTDLDLDSPEGRGLAIADNRVAEVGLNWDEENLRLIGEELDLGEFFFDDELQLLNLDSPDSEGEVEGLTDEDAVPEAQAEAVSATGDLWLLGDHRVLCGDSTSAEDVARLMNGERADMVFTDPPYGVSYQSNRRKRSERFDVLQNDDTLLDGWIKLAVEHCEGFIFSWCSWSVFSEWFEIWSAESPVTNVVIWNKGGGGLGDLKKTFFTDYEIALVMNQGAQIPGHRHGSVWTIGKDGASTYLHPTQKPVELAVFAMEAAGGVEAKTVLDFFLGSGSTLIAAEQTGRRCYGLELAPTYVDVIVRRWQDYTGKAATLEDGRTFDEVKAERAESDA